MGRKNNSVLRSKTLSKMDAKDKGARSVLNRIQSTPAVTRGKDGKPVKPLYEKKPISPEEQYRY